MVSGCTSTIRYSRRSPKEYSYVEFNNVLGRTAVFVLYGHQAGALERSGSDRAEVPLDFRANLALPLPLPRRTGRWKQDMTTQK